MAEIIITVTGDFCPVHRLENLSGNTSPEEILGGLLPVIKSSDIAITNLECPITENKTSIGKTGPALKGKPEALDFLINSGFNLVTLSNNHIMDYGNKGLKDTIDHLNSKKLAFIGAGNNIDEASKITYVEKDGNKVAIINLSENEWSTTNGDYPGACPMDLALASRLIAVAKEHAQFVLFIVHGGHEMYQMPSPRMQSWYRAFIDWGADAVINHHTHCVSGMENYKGKPIFYSLGNFLFDSPKLRQSIWNKGNAVVLKINGNQLQFETIYFYQCREKEQLEIIPSNNPELAEELSNLNIAVSNTKLLETKFNQYCKEKTKMYNNYLEPISSKILMFLMNRGIIPTFWSKRKRYYLHNLVRCEAHRDVVINILDHENSHS
jgi:poly-gamma-glutamate capsule biosynthesis protein CapA/YwtB (metallophosphatase superfamily)